jgi:hypothetical protein
MATTMKMKVNSTVATDGQVAVQMSADYADEKNKEWAKYTPNASYNFVVKEELADEFPIGASFTVTFEKE